MAEQNEQQSFLDKIGLAHLWAELKVKLAGKETSGAAATVQENLDSHTGNTSNPHNVTKTQVGLGAVDNTSDADKPVSTAQASAIADAKKAGTDAQAALTSHNTDTAAHNDLRLELKALADRINAALDSDDETLDELSEIVAYIKSNKELIDAITTSKVSVADIVNDLVTNVANKPLSAAQGVALKKLIDDLEASIPSGITVDSALSETSTNPVQNKVINSALAGKADSDHTHDAQVSMHGITTAGTGAAYTASVDGITALTAGASFIMLPHTTSTAVAPTLNVNSLGAKTIRRRVSNSTVTTVAATDAGWLYANKPIRVTYDGTYWVADMTRPNAVDIYGTVAIAQGGTGASTAAQARTNLGLTTENFVFTLEDGSTVTKAVYVG